MRPVKLFSSIILIFGIILIVIGFIGLIFFQISLGEVNVGISNKSSIFYLKEGRSYSITVIGLNHAFGHGTGQLTILSENDSWNHSYQVTYSFDGDSDVSEIVAGQLRVPASGNYYLLYSESSTDIYSGHIKLVVRESLIKTITGLEEFILILIGFLLIGVSIFGFFISTFITLELEDQSPDINHVEETQILKEYREEIDKSQDFTPISRDSTNSLPRKECPLCGNISDGIYCDKCGSNIREGV